MSKSRSQKSEKSSSIWELTKTILVAALIALGFRMFVFEPFNIPSGSMIPTLLIGDYLFVSKYAYGYSAKSIAWGQDLFEGRVWSGEPERGDVIVFKLPGNESTDYIKRLIGLPGDRLQVRNGRLFINDQLVERQQIEDFVLVNEVGRRRAVPQYRETLPNGRTYSIIESLGDRPTRTGSVGAVLQDADNTPVYTVPPEHYFFMGDNRDGSQDSRFSSPGFVPRDNLVGRAEFLFFSLDGGAGFLEVWRWPFELRLGRLGSSIE